MTTLAAQFPSKIAFGARSEPEWFTTVVSTFNGFELTNQNWQNVRHTYDVSFAVRTATDYQTVRNHFHMARGRAKKFLFRDPLDNSCTLAQGPCPVDPGVSEGWLLVKRYGTAPDHYDRRITRPVSGTVKIYRDRSSVVTDVTASATIDYTTGKFTITGHVNGDVYGWEGDFLVPCRYDTDRLPTMVVNRNSPTELLVQCDSIIIVEVRE